MSLNFGAGRTSSSVMCVSRVMWSGIGTPGFTKVENSASALPFTKRTAPTSITRSCLKSSPVVSTSSATKSGMSMTLGAGLTLLTGG
ncbi:hypothetical protein R80B4_01925 [Fibrobacteres bacterium R8-0-B4]